MMKSNIKRALILFGLILGLRLSAVSASAAVNANDVPMKISKTQGTVAILDSANKPQKALNNAELLSGYSIATNEAGYAWINLDDTKLVKMDALSRIRVTKTGKNFRVDVVSGKIMFDVSKHLEKDENLSICTANVITDIKGASGEISVENDNTVIVGLDGQISCTAIDTKTGKLRPIEVTAGKLLGVKSTASGLSVNNRAATKADISGFSKIQIVQNPVLKERIVAQAGAKLGNISIEESIASFNQDVMKQATEVATIAAAKGVDPQVAINSMMGADISYQTLESTPSSVNIVQPVVSIQEDSSSSSSSSEETSSSSDKESNKESDDSSDKPSSSTDEHEHSYNLESTIPASCKEEGVKTYKCSVCGDVKTESIAKTTEHSYVEEITKQESCKEEGVKTYKCSVCGDIKTESIAKTTEHSYVEESTTQASCKEEGVKTYKCSICGDIKTKSIAKTDNHNYVEEEGKTKPKTCTEDGKRFLKCSICDNEIQEKIPAAHTYSGEEIDDRVVGGEEADNCTEIEMGKFKHCTACNKDIKQGTYQLYPDHSFVEEVDTPATCTSDKILKFDCTNMLSNNSSSCTYFEKREIPGTRSEHSFVGEEGSKVCSQCGYYEN